MTLPKHLRPRYRYLAVVLRTNPGETLTRRETQTALWEAARALLGDTGSAAADLSIQRFDPNPNHTAVIVRTRRGEEPNARAILACVSEIDDVPVGVMVTGVSGTIRACAENHFPAEGTNEA